MAPEAMPYGEPTLFESGHVRPLALAANGQRLYAVNTPDHRVEVLDVSGAVPAWNVVENVPREVLLPPSEKPRRRVVFEGKRGRR